MSYLLNNIGTAVDPAMLVEKIAPGCVIPGLKSSLAKMMKDYGLQVGYVTENQYIIPTYTIQYPLTYLNNEFLIFLQYKVSIVFKIQTFS